VNDNRKNICGERLFGQIPPIPSTPMHLVPNREPDPGCEKYWVFFMYLWSKSRPKKNLWRCPGKAGDIGRRSFCQNHEADDDHGKGPGYEKKSGTPAIFVSAGAARLTRHPQKNAGESLFCATGNNGYASPTQPGHKTARAPNTSRTA